MPQANPPIHPATALMRELIQASAEYSRRLGADLEVNPTDLRAMEYLMQHGASPIGELAKALDITAGAMTQAVDRLERVGHATRERSETDRRQVVVVPNPDSVRRAWAEIRPLIETSQRAIANLSPDQQEAVVTFLQAMVDAYSADSVPANSQR